MRRAESHTSLALCDSCHTKRHGCWNTCGFEAPPCPWRHPNGGCTDVTKPCYEGHTNHRTESEPLYVGNCMIFVNRATGSSCPTAVSEPSPVFGSRHLGLSRSAIDDLD